MQQLEDPRRNGASVDCCAVNRASGGLAALGAIESDLAVREAAYRDRADALSRV
jgi:hypothetical protein